MTPMLMLSCMPHMLQDAKDAVAEAATAGALDRRLAAVERRVSARLIKSCYRGVSIYWIFPAYSELLQMLRHPVRSNMLRDSSRQKPGAATVLHANIDC